MTEGYKAIVWMLYIHTIAGVTGVHCIFHIYNVGTKVIWAAVIGDWLYL